MLDLHKRVETGEAVCAGVLSGTSADGIDVVLARFALDERAQEVVGHEALGFETLPFPAPLGRRVRALLDGEPAGVREVALLDRDLGRTFGLAAAEVARRHGLPLDLIGSHGQTVYHHDGNEPSGPATLQLGDGDHAARASGVHVVSDFRQADLAAGGEGAPLSALADPVLFRALPRPAAILNLGGLANLTILDGEAGALAFDTGPCNALFDGLARRLLGRPFDEDGSRAGAGRANERLVRELLSHPFLEETPPKSTGRDTFGEPFVEAVLTRAQELGVLENATDGKGAEDLLASATAFVARSIELALNSHAPGIKRLVLAGGGLNHRPLLDALGRSGREVYSSGEFGVDPDGREALVFALFAVRRVLELPSTDGRATGAAAGGVLGKLSAPPQER